MTDLGGEPFFGDSQLERLMGDERGSVEKMNAIWKDPKTKVLVIYGLRALCLAPDEATADPSKDGDGTFAALTSAGNLPRQTPKMTIAWKKIDQVTHVPSAGPFVEIKAKQPSSASGQRRKATVGNAGGSCPIVACLGRAGESGAPIFAAIYERHVSAHRAPSFNGHTERNDTADGCPVKEGQDESYAELWSSAPFMSPLDTTYIGFARSMSAFFSNHKFCGRCGGQAIPAAGGSKVQCQGACGREVFPRVDPVAIMAIDRTVDGKRELLLGRQATWPAGMWSLLAGFVETAERLEETVIREVKEESGVVVSLSSVNYVGCQPWPMPGTGGQLMVGCIGSVDTSVPDSDKIDTSHDDLEQAAWYSVDEIQQAVSGDRSSPIRLPPKTATARRLIHWWLEHVVQVTPKASL